MEYTTGAPAGAGPGGREKESAGWTAPAAVAPALVAGRAVPLPLARAAVAVVGGALALRALGRVRLAVAALALGRRRAEVGLEGGVELPGAGEGLARGRGVAHL